MKNDNESMDCQLGKSEIQDSNQESEDKPLIEENLISQSVEVPEEVTEALENGKNLIGYKKSKRGYIILGLLVGVIIFLGGTFLILSQMKTSQMNKALDLGEKYLEEGKYEEAILAFDEVITIEPKQVAAYEGKGASYLGLDNYSEAETQLENAKAIDFTDNGKVLMADVYINTQRKDQGVDLIDEVLKKEPGETKTIIQIADLYSQINEYAKVIDLTEKQIGNTQDKEELKKLYNQLIGAYIKSGKTEAEILALLERAANATGDQSYIQKKESYIVKKPSFNLAPGEYQGAQTLEIIKGNAADKVYYTIDGTEPSIISSEYTAPISMQPGDITVKLIEVNEQGVKSPVIVGTYTVKTNWLIPDEIQGKWVGDKYILIFSGNDCSFGNRTDGIQSTLVAYRVDIKSDTIIWIFAGTATHALMVDKGAPNDGKIKVDGETYVYSE
ncbi:chitobiase/beta-hexosaminidase C-terminal domain-containing protein [Acetobacterium sp.]|uniref:chitobiase/beta-hexosaminidase C-terminal domain-containing protein n=1 Tax=Acetobacterium sp. TaxID=1872094 RepID=UPI00359381D6